MGGSSEVKGKFQERVEESGMSAKQLAAAITDWMDVAEVERFADHLEDEEVGFVRTNDDVDDGGDDGQKQAQTRTGAGHSRGSDWTGRLQVRPAVRAVGLP